MKKLTKTALAATLAAFMLLTALPLSLAAKALAPKHNWTVPAGYNEHDYTKCVGFLEQADEDGVKNGTKLNESYDPNDPETWERFYSGDARFQWTSVSGEQRLAGINVYGYNLIGSLDVSGCIALARLWCFENQLTELDVSSCTALTELWCYENQLTELDVSSCTALTELSCSYNQLTELDISSCTALTELDCAGNLITELDVLQNAALTNLICGYNLITELDVTQNTALTGLECYYNQLTELDVSQNTALNYLSCSGNRLTELDVSQNTALNYLDCWDNQLTELDLRNNPELPGGLIRAEGSGYVGYWGESIVCAQPHSFVNFEGFYTEGGELISEGEFNEEYGHYYYYLPDSFGKANIIARFSPAPAGAPGSGDINGDEATTADDAIIDLRAALGLVELPEAQLAAGDMNGDGVIDVSDAILILRAAMGL